MIQFDEHIFKKGWFNDQPEYIQVVWTQLFLGLAMFVARSVSTRLPKEHHKASERKSTPFICTGRFHYVDTGGWTVGFLPYDTHSIHVWYSLLPFTTQIHQHV